MIATFADDTVILTSNKKLDNAVTALQQQLDITALWFQKWNIKINEDKTVFVIYTTRKVKNKPTIKLNKKLISCANSAKYLGMHIDQKLNWKLHIISKRNQIKDKFRQLYWLLKTDSRLSIENKLLLYKTTIKPIWTYGLQLWGTAKKTNIKTIQRLQTKLLRTIVNAAWYVSNDDLHRDLNMKTVIEEIRHYSYKHQQQILQHDNHDINTLPLQEQQRRRRLSRARPTDLISFT